jgi:hypothetical protein
VIASPFQLVQNDLLRDHKAAHAQWKIDFETAKQNKAPIPERPHSHRVLARDFTIEALIRRLAQAPRGLLCPIDEISGLLSGLNQYKGGKGNDRQKILEIWKHVTVMIDRVNHEEGIPVIYVPNPFLGIIGGINSGNLPLFLGSNGNRGGDGHIDRYLFAYPEQIPKPNWSWNGLPDKRCEDWKKLINRLLGRPMAQNAHGEVFPYVYQFDPRGEDAWESFYNDHVAEMCARDFPNELRGPWIKLEEYAGRLTLILALTEYAVMTSTEKYRNDDTDNKYCKFNWVAAIINAWNLVDYFKAQAQRVSSKIEKLVPTPVGANESREIQEVLNWIEKNRRATFQATDLQFIRCFRGDPRRRDKTLEEMERRNHIRRLPDPVLKGTKRASPSYEVKPTLRTWETPPPPAPENNCQNNRHKIAGDWSANGTVSSDVTVSGEKTSDKEVVPDPENNCQNRQNCQGEENTLQAEDLPPSTDDPLFTVDNPPLPSNGDSWEPRSLPSSEDLLSSALLPSDSSPGNFGDFGNYSSQQSSEARSNSLCEDELERPVLPASPESAGNFAGNYSPSAGNSSPSDPSNPNPHVPDPLTEETGEPPVELSSDPLDYEKESSGDT